MTSTFTLKQRAHSSMWLWTAVVGISFPVLDLLSENLPLLLLTSLRFSVALIALLPFIPAAERQTPSFKALVMYTALGFCLSGFFGTMLWAAPRISAVTMSSIYVTVPLISFLLSTLINSPAGAKSLLPVLLTGATGALLLARAGIANEPGQAESVSGMTVFLVGCFGAAIYPVLSKWGIHQGWLKESAVTRTAWSLLSGAIFTAVAGMLTENPHSLMLLTFYDAGILVFLGIFSTALTFWLTQYATSYLLPPEVQAYSYVVPLISIAVLLAQGVRAFTWQWVPGGILVLLCIGLLLNRKTENALSTAGIKL